MIEWRRTEATGAVMPIDPDPVADGNLLITDLGEVRVLGPLEVELHRAEHRHLSHFVTCPEADQFRKGKS